MDRKSAIVSALNGLVNPILMCSFLPIIEGKPALDMSSPTGFWGQLGLAVLIAEIVSFLPAFGRMVGMCVEFSGFRREGPGARICGTVVGATFLFALIGLFEIAFQTGFGVVNGYTYFSRWASLVTGGWLFVVVGGLLFDPFAHSIAAALTKPKSDKAMG